MKILKDLFFHFGTPYKLFIPTLNLIGYLFEKIFRFLYKIFVTFLFLEFCYEKKNYFTTNMKCRLLFDLINITRNIDYQFLSLWVYLKFEIQIDSSTTIVFVKSSQAKRKMYTKNREENQDRIRPSGTDEGVGERGSWKMKNIKFYSISTVQAS